MKNSVLKKIAALISMTAIISLSGCGKGAPAPSSLPTDVLTQLRGIDANENGIREDIEKLTGPMSISVEEQLRLLAFAWTIQQGMEVSMLGDEANISKLGQLMIDGTECLIFNAKNGDIANHLMNINLASVDTSLRKDAWTIFSDKINAKYLVASDTPCLQVDILAARIHKKTSEMHKSRE